MSASVIQDALKGQSVSSQYKSVTASASDLD